MQKALMIFIQCLSVIQVMKFQVSIFSLLLASISALPLEFDSSAVSENPLLKIDRETAKEILKLKILIKYEPKTGFFENLFSFPEGKDCMLDFLNITLDGTENSNSTVNLNRIELFKKSNDFEKLNFIFENLDFKCFMTIIYGSIDQEKLKLFRKKLREDEEDEGEISEKAKIEIQCKKIFLSEIKPNSELLQGFDIEYAKTLTCNETNASKKNQEGFYKAAFKSLTFEDYTEMMVKVTIEFYEVLSMFYEKISDKELFLRYQEGLKLFNNVMKTLINEALSEFEE